MYDKLQPFTIVSLPLTFPNDTFEMADQANIQSDELPDIQPPNPLGFNILLHEGLYIITNKMSRTTVDLPNGTEGTRCHGFSQNLNEYFGNQLWLVLRSGPSSETFTLQNFEHVTFLEVSGGRADDGAIVVSRARAEAAESRLNQEWSIVKQAAFFRTIQCASTRTFLEIINGNPSEWAGIACSRKAMKGDYQLWDLNRVSRSSAEIKAIIQMWKPDLPDRLLEPHDDSVEYFVLPGQLRRTIWEGTKLLHQPVHQQMFDYDDFVIKSKDAVKTWARDRFSKAPGGYCVLFGLIFGKAARGPNAYNWYLASDMRSLVFFDAQTGKEYSTAALDEFEFKPKFATF